MYYIQIEDRLWDWARWWKAVESGCDGYPKRSMIQVFRDGAVLTGEFRSLPLISNPKAQEMDILIKRMTCEYPQYGEIITAHYLWRKDPFAKLQELRISKRTFYRRLEGAKNWLLDKMESEQKLQDMI